MSQSNIEQLESASNGIVKALSQLSEQNTSLVILLLAGGVVSVGTIFALSYFVKSLNSQ